MTTITNPRPPRLWWGLMFKRAKDSYPRNKDETKEHWEKDIARIVGGIWAKSSSQTKEKILLAYAKDENPTNEEEIFIRAETKSEHNKSHSYPLAHLPDKPGYRKGYKPYGKQGAGYYYIKEQSQTGNPIGLKCPLCGETNPNISKPNVFLKCKCGAKLVSVRVVRKK